MEQQLSLFGEEEIKPTVKRIGRDEKFNDYETFLDRFSEKKTTDDCYTPPAVYDVVKNFVGELTDLTDRAIVRPFYPGGDYQKFAYPDSCIVIDNPPFSIVTKIVRWYETAGIDYFLFAPHLTIFDCQATCSILCDANVVYENGAVVKTSFVTNIVPDLRVWLNADLRQRINAISQTAIRTTEKKIYPANVINAASCGKYLARGVNVKIPKEESQYVRNLDNLKSAGKRIFGGGMLLSDRVAALITADMEYEREVTLSDRERRIVEKLSSNSC